MDYRIVKPLHGKIFVQPVDEGILVKGNLKGVVVAPCNRCTEDATIKIDTEFSEYEDILPESGTKMDEQGGMIVYEKHAPMLNLAEVGWEQFMLALPIQPLCKEDCKGLCPKCGSNLNNDACSCATDDGDPRMGALRGLSVNKK